MNSLAGIVIDMEWLMNSAAVFSGIAICILLFIVFYLFFFQRNKRKFDHLDDLYSNFLSEIILSETPEEYEAVFKRSYVKKMLHYWLRQDEARQMLISTMVKAKKSVYGSGGDNIVALYNQLDLAKDSYRRMRRGNWDVKAKAIQGLAEMEQLEFLPKIYKETNNRNVFVRKEAQVAVVKLTGVDGLRFLNVLSQPMSQWEQICLLEQLPDYAEISVEKAENWLQSGNISVMEFAISLAGKFNMYSLQQKIVDMLDHPSPNIQRLAAHTLVELDQESTPALLIERFDASSEETRVNILEILRKTSFSDHLAFLAGVSKTGNIELKLRAEEMLRTLQTGGTDN